ncbi:MAG TPA: type II toxin-antitoxin system HicB family antitoxin [Candidatus Cybelea sp.]|nr:type II toxin-antitoxin system HicB family antitoxin [Candidatus Cybelea sp.]
MKYAVVIERSEDGWGVYPVDLPGVGVVADTPEQALDRINQAIGMQLETLGRVGGYIPSPTPWAVWATPHFEFVLGLIPPAVVWNVPGVQIFGEATSSMGRMMSEVVPQAFGITARDYATPRLTPEPLPA